MVKIVRDWSSLYATAWPASSSTAHAAPGFVRILLKWRQPQFSQLIANGLPL